MAGRTAAGVLAVAVAVAGLAGWASATAYDSARVEADVEAALADPAVQRQLVAAAEQAVDDAIGRLGDTGVVRTVAEAAGTVERTCASLAARADAPRGDGLFDGITGAADDALGAAGGACLDALAELQRAVEDLRSAAVQAAGAAAQTALEQPAVRAAMARGTAELHRSLGNGGRLEVPLEPVVRELAARGEWTGADPLTARLVEVAVDRTLDAVTLPTVDVQVEPDGAVPWFWRSADAVRTAAVVAAVVAAVALLAVALTAPGVRTTLRRSGAALLLALPVGTAGWFVLRAHATALDAAPLRGAAEAALLTALPEAVALAGVTLVLGAVLVLAAGRDRRGTTSTPGT